MKEVMGMNLLLVSVEDDFPMTEVGKHNLKNISEVFSYDLITLKPKFWNMVEKHYTTEFFKKYSQAQRWVLKNPIK